jgi:Transglutaminase-like superfamily
MGDSVARLTSWQIAKRGAFAGVLTLLLVLADYCYVQHVHESRWLAAMARRVISRTGASTPRERARALRDYVRQSVTYHGAPFYNRPFLRATARETLESGLGYCGESTRAFVRLAMMQGLRAQRINLHGRLRHVVAEVEFEQGRRVLFDPQNNPDLNPYFDESEISVDELLNQPGVPFSDYSNLNLRRFPVLGHYIQRIKITECMMTRMLESPWLIASFVLQLIAAGMILAFVADRVLVRVYSRRLRPPSLAIHPVAAAPIPQRTVRTT